MSDVFVAIDFETADPKRDSACQVGLVRVEFGEIVSREVRLIRPPRDGVGPMQYAIHRIPWNRLKGEPKFPVVWRSLLPVLDGVERFVAHNAPFDRSVLRACCAAYSIDPPALPWICTQAVSRQRWRDPGVRHGLVDVCRRLNITVARHHDAGADAEMAANVLIALEGLGSADARERARLLAGLFERAAGRAVWACDSRMASCEAVKHGKVRPELDLFCVEGDGRWLTVPRGDLGNEPDPEDLVPAAGPATLFDRHDEE